MRKKHKIRKKYLKKVATKKSQRWLEKKTQKRKRRKKKRKRKKNGPQFAKVKKYNSLHVSLQNGLMVSPDWSSVYGGYTFDWRSF